MIVRGRSPKITSAHFNFCRIVALALYVSFATVAAFAQFTAGIQGNIRDTGGANIRTLK
jgi:hypothetical protein